MVDDDDIREVGWKPRVLNIGLNIKENKFISALTHSLYYYYYFQKTVSKAASSSQA